MSPVACLEAPKTPVSVTSSATELVDVSQLADTTDVEAKKSKEVSFSIMV